MLTLPSLFSNPIYSALFATLVMLAVGSLAIFAEEYTARRDAQELQETRAGTASLAAQGCGCEIGQLVPLLIAPLAPEALN